MKIELEKGDILKMVIYHTGGMTCKEIGEKLGLSRMRVAKELTARGYKPYYREKPKPSKHWLFKEG